MLWFCFLFFTPTIISWMHTYTKKSHLLYHMTPSGYLTDQALLSCKNFRQEKKKQQQIKGAGGLYCHFTQILFHFVPEFVHLVLIMTFVLIYCSFLMCKSACKKKIFKKKCWYWILKPQPYQALNLLYFYYSHPPLLADSLR